MRYLGKLITQARRSTDNLDGSTITGNGGVGISDNEIIQYFNDGQDRVQSLADAEFTPIFIKTGNIATVANQSDYDLPTDIYGTGKVSLVEFRKDSSAQFFPIRPLTPEMQGFDSSDNTSTFDGIPLGYQIRGGKLVITPTPRSNVGTYRLTYPAFVDRLDIRRGQVTSTTDDATDYLTILLDDDVNLDNTEINANDTLSVVDKEGVMIYRNIEYTAYDQSTRVLTLASGVALATAVISTGDYITLDRNAVTHSTLPNFVERYLITYAEWKLLVRRSSTDAAAKQTELSAIETDISESFRQTTHDVRRIPRISDLWT